VSRLLYWSKNWLMRASMDGSDIVGLDSQNALLLNVMIIPLVR
jgi:hypothetical protein